MGKVKGQKAGVMINTKTKKYIKNTKKVVNLESNPADVVSSSSIPSPDEINNISSEDSEKPKNAKKNKIKSKKPVKTEVCASPKSKKIMFVDDEPVVVKLKATNTKNKKLLINDEEEVKDEDIDAFCDDLDEKDNEVYENWVKLFEENFRSNKKKT